MTRKAIKKKKEGPVRVMVVDDHPLMRKGIRDIIESEAEFSVCCEADSANRAIRMIAREEPDIVIVDISLGGEASGIDLIRALAARKIKTRALVLSMHTDTFFVERAIRAGARGYIAKSEAPRIIIEALRSVLRGGLYVSGSISGAFIDRLMNEQRWDTVLDIECLSNRELEILELIGRGFKSSEISKKLNISVNTVECHRKNIRTKLKIETSADLARNAIAWVHSMKK
ncbi:MAG: hypothetical protein A2176_07700 [Spirochaetes bacterium RBG_13_51_14]|nr:MAG: hypothetical protein A2176_07700 [Spirochaetes bacterium RBG_13_51_14]